MSLWLQIATEVHRSYVCTWWRHQMETFSALLAICAGNSPVSGEFPAQGPVTRNFDVFFDLRMNERLSKHSWGWWLETPSRPLWRQSDDCTTNVGWNIVGRKPLWRSFSCVRVMWSLGDGCLLCPELEHTLAQTTKAKQNKTKNRCWMNAVIFLMRLS